MITDLQIKNSARTIIEEKGEIHLHDLVHEIAQVRDCFGEIDGSKVNSVGIVMDEENVYPKILKTKHGYKYIAEAPVEEA